MKKLLPVLTICFVALGCMPSLHPLYTDKDSVFDTKLLGKWVEDDGRISYEFMSNNGTNYTMVYTEDSVSSNFTTYLIKFGDHLFMDICPKKAECGNDFYTGYLLPVHSFYKVVMNGDKLRLDGLDGDWVEAGIKKGKIALAHEFLDDNEGIILTASSVDLQNFVVANANNTDAFPKGSEAHRVE